MEGQQARENLVNLIRANPAAFKAAFFQSANPNVEELTAALTGKGTPAASPVPNDKPSTVAPSGKIPTGGLPNELSSKVHDEAAKYREFLKSAKQQGQKPMHMEPDLITGSIFQQMSNPELFIHRSFPLLIEAHQQMCLAKKKFSPEQSYRALFDDMLQNPHDWELFYSLENNKYLWAERTCGILGNLATTYRQRGDHARCDEVMVRYKKVLDNYNAMIARRHAARLSDTDELVCCRSLTNKYHRIAAYLAGDIQRTTGMAESYRNLIQYELETGVTEDDDEYAWMLGTILRKPRTLKALAATTDKELMLCCEFIHKQNLNAPKEQPKTEQEYRQSFPGQVWGGAVQLAVCAGCNTTEPFLSTYKACGRCKAVKYCGRDCQVAHYKVHKAACKQAAGSLGTK